MYCVLPRLLLDMKPTPESINLACRDVFYANIRAHEDGSIRSATAPVLLADDDLHERLLMHNGTNINEAIIDSARSPWIGPTRIECPDKPLHLGIERPLHYGAPDICFTGRVDGDVIGIASVKDVLYTIARSLAVPSGCSHDTEPPMTVLNVRTSAWLASKFAKPAGTPTTPTLLSVKGDACWALLAAGQTVQFSGCLVLGCIHCAHALGVAHSAAAVLVGYK